MDVVDPFNTFHIPTMVVQAYVIQFLEGTTVKSKQDVHEKVKPSAGDGARLPHPRRQWRMTGVRAHRGASKEWWQ